MVARAAAVDSSVQNLIDSGKLNKNQLYHAAVALQRLHDRGIGRSLTLLEMCEVLGYVAPRVPRRSRA